MKLEHFFITFIGTPGLLLVSFGHFIISIVLSGKISFMINGLETFGFMKDSNEVVVSGRSLIISLVIFEK